MYICVLCSKDSNGTGRVCGCCAEHFTLPPAGPLQGHLDSAPFPAFVVDLYADTYMIIKAVNKNACAWIGKDPQEIVQHLIGNVIECASARCSEGCGNAALCQACAIRKSVTRTARTGKPLLRVPFDLHRGDIEHPAVVRLFLTTVKAGARVLMRIDQE